MSFFDFLISIQGIIGVVIGFILRGLREKGEVHAFLYDDKVIIKPKGKKIDGSSSNYAYVDSVREAVCGSGSLDIEIFNDARLPKKIIINKIKFPLENEMVIGKVTNIKIKDKNYGKDSFISLDSLGSKKGKFYVEVTKEDLKKIEDKTISPNRLVGLDSRKNKIYIKIH